VSAADEVRPPVRLTERDRAPVDWDRVQALVDAVTIRLLYLTGIVLAVIGLADLFGWGAGGLVLLVAAGVPGALRYREAVQRRRERERLEREAEFRGGGGRATGFDVPVRP
jgi:hypothetical protein